MLTCDVCLEAPSEAMFAGVPVCLPCCDRALLEPALLAPRSRQCSRCHGSFTGGRRDEVPVCRPCVEAELDRAQALEIAPAWLREALPPLDERWKPRPLALPRLTAVEEAEQDRELRRQFRETGRIFPPPPPKRHWLDD